MDERNFVDTIKDSWYDLVDGAVEYAPKILVAVLLLIVGVFVAKYVSKMVGKAFDFLENSKPVRSGLNELGVKNMDIDGVVSTFTRWAILIVFMSAAVNALGLQVLTDTFNSIIDFIPNILAAAIVAGLSFFAANAVRDVVKESAKNAGVHSANFLAQASRVAVLVFGLPLAVAQLGLDLTLITNNLTVIVGGVMLAIGLAFGLGGKDTAGKIVDDLYKNWKK